MREQLLRQFFEGNTNARDLAKDITGSTKQSSSTIKITSVEDMEREFEVKPEMAIRLCDAVLSGDLPAESLNTIGFVLIASDKFHWHGDQDEVLASVIADWSCPEINYPLTIENVGRFRAWLTGREPYPIKAVSSRSPSPGPVLSRHEKRAMRSVWKRLTK